MVSKWAKSPFLYKPWLLQKGAVEANLISLNSFHCFSIQDCIRLLHWIRLPRSKIVVPWWWYFFGKHGVMRNGRGRGRIVKAMIPLRTQKIYSSWPMCIVNRGCGSNLFSEEIPYWFWGRQERERERERCVGVAIHPWCVYMWYIYIYDVLFLSIFYL